MPIEPVPKIHLRLLGPFGVVLDDQPMPPVRSRSGMHLLALLALHANREVARDWLAGTLWPDSLEEQALANLRRTHTLLLRLTENECDLLAFDARLQETERAACLYGAAMTQFERSETLLPPNVQSGHDASVGAPRSALGESEFARLWAEGAALSLEQAIEFAAVL